MSLNNRMIELLSDSRMACNGRLIADDVSDDFREEIDELFTNCKDNIKLYEEKLTSSEIEIVTTDHIDEIDEIIVNIEDSILDDVNDCFDHLNVFLVERIDDDSHDLVVEEDIQITIDDNSIPS